QRLGALADLHARLVAGQRKKVAVAEHASQRSEVVVEGARILIRLGADMRRRPLENVVAGERDARRLVDEAEVAVRVPGGVHSDELAARDREDGAVGDRAVRLRVLTPPGPLADGGGDLCALVADAVRVERSLEPV